MTDFLQAGLNLLPSLLPHRDVTYQRRGHRITIKATLGSTRMAYENEFGVRQYTETRDYLVEPSQISFDDIVSEPEEGDFIIDSGITYKVMPTGTDEAWRYTDRHHTMLRIHVGKVDE